MTTRQIGRIFLILGLVLIGVGALAKSQAVDMVFVVVGAILIVIGIAMGASGGRDIRGVVAEQNKKTVENYVRNKPLRSEIQEDIRRWRESKEYAPPDE